MYKKEKKQKTKRKKQKQKQTIYNHPVKNYVISKLRGGAGGVMVIVVGNGHGSTSSNPGRD